MIAGIFFYLWPNGFEKSTSHVGIVKRKTNIKNKWSYGKKKLLVTVSVTFMDNKKSGDAKMELYQPGV